MFNQAKEIIILSDHTKFNRYSLVQVASISSASTIIINSKTPSNIIDAIAHMGVCVEIANHTNTRK